MDKALCKTLQEKAKEIRKLTIKEIGQLTVGHIGGAVDLAELLAVLYYHAMNIDPADSKMPGRDRFILSKGHGGPALYSVLAMKGYIPMEALDTLNQPGTNLPSHCDMNRTNGIDMTTGSLGQGFSCAVGMALAAKMDQLPSYIYTCIGDGESQEGQIWEAAMLAASNRLGNLIAFTDYNKMQIDGYIEEINRLHPLDKKWESFGWHVQSIDGHSVEQIAFAIDNAKKVRNTPSMILLNTIKGKGCCFCENMLSSHSVKNITEEMWKEAIAKLDGEDA
ncbi:MAG: transketolase [Clostridiales bacterium]|nr:transketolase [Clostridiales bacterium]